MVYCKFRRVLKQRQTGTHNRHPENFEYKDIMLQICDGSTSFEPDSQIMKTIKEMEKDLKQNSEKHRSNSLNLETILSVGRQRRRRNEITARNCRKCGLIISENMREASTSNPYSGGLGPLLCRTCSLVLQSKVENEQLQQTITEMAASVYTQYTVKEKAILALLYNRNASSRADSIPKGDSFIRRKPLPFTLKQIPRGQTCVPCRNPSIKRLETYRKSYCTASLKQSFRSASKVTACIDNNRDMSFEPRKEIARAKPSSNKKLSDFQIVAQKVRAPSNSRCSVKDDEVENIVNGVRYLKFRIPRTDLEWYEDISERKQESNREMELKKTQLDVIQLSSKLSTVFRERNLPPSRKSRTSSISSIDSHFREQYSPHSETDPKTSIAGVPMHSPEDDQSSIHGHSSSVTSFSALRLSDSGRPSDDTVIRREGDTLKEVSKDQASLSPPCIVMETHRAISSPVYF